MRIASMAGRFRTLIGACAAVGVAVSALPAQSRPTGLDPAPPQYLAKIPDAFSPFGGDALPRQVDLSPSLPPPGNQGDQSSCVAWTIAYALRSYQAQVRERVPLVVGGGAIDSARVFSPAFVYNQLNNGRNAGLYFGDALNLVQDIGSVPLAVMPYDRKDFLTQPDSEMMAMAGGYRLLSWKKVDFHDIIEIKSQVNAGYPVMIGAAVDEGFMNAGKNFVWRAAEGKPLGNHAMLIVGYDDERHALRGINSWGTTWGDGGYYWLDYDYMPKIVHEAYVAKDRPPPPKVVMRELPANGPKPVTVAPPRGGVKPKTLTPTAPAVTPVIRKAVIPSLRLPAPTSFDDAVLTIVRTRQESVDPQLGRGIRFDGVVTVPAAGQGTLQIVIHFFADSAGRKGRFIRATTPRFSVGRERAATGTSPMPLPENRSTTLAWVAFLPYSALDLSFAPPGAVRLRAEPVLYVDRFGVKAGTPSVITCACGR